MWECWWNLLEASVVFIFRCELVPLSQTSCAYRCPCYSYRRGHFALGDLGQGEGKARITYKFLHGELFSKTNGSYKDLISEPIQYSGRRRKVPSSVNEMLQPLYITAQKASQRQEGGLGMITKTERRGNERHF